MKLVSGVATRVTPPEGLADVRPGDEAAFLSPLPATLLPAIRPHREGRLLADLNLRRVTEVAALPLARLLLAFRERAYSLYRQARGQDDSPVRPPSRRSEIFVEETLAEDSNDDGLLRALLFLLVERAGRRLRAARCQAVAARLAIRYADRHLGSRHLRLWPPPTDDRDLFARLEALLVAVAARRTRIVWMGLTLSDLRPLSRQLPLFGDENGSGARDRRLCEALDRLRARHGEGVVRRLTPPARRAYLAAPTRSGR